MSGFDHVLVPLHSARDPALFGGKAASLARMLAAGFAVPPGYVVADGALQRQLRQAGLAAAVEALHDSVAAAEPAQMEEGARDLATRLRATPLAPELQAALRTVDWAHDDAPLAVRSSAVGEDSAAHSYAGQLDSVLHVRGDEDLRDAVLAVWASMWTPRCLHYQRQRGLRVTSMGVIVQTQVDARHAGVLFTRAPVATAGAVPDMVIEYCSGLADRLVSGEAEPARILFDRQRGAIRSHGEGEADCPLLDDGDIRTLVREALRLEAHFGEPLDIEWAFDVAGKLWLLQARPITAASAPLRPVVWTNANIAENFPEPVSPFLHSIVRRGYAAYFRNLGIGFGISARRIAAMHDALEQIVGTHGGRLYYNLTNIHAVIALAPGGPWLVGAFNNFVGATEMPTPLGVPQLGRVGRGLEWARVGMKTTAQYVRVNAGLTRFESSVDAFCARTEPTALARMSTTDLRNALREFLAIRLTRWNAAALADTAAMVCYGALQRQLRRWLPSTDSENLHNNLLIGLPGLASHTPVEKLWDLSRAIRANPALESVFASADVATLEQRLRDEPRLTDFRAAFARYLEQWGFRSSGELMLTRPSPEEDARPTLELLRSYAQMDAPSPQHQLAEQAAAREVATREVERRLTPNALWRALPFSRAWQLRRLLAATHGAIRLRERARQKQAKLYVRLRHIARAIGGRLVASGHLAVADDVFFLTCEEVDALPGDDATTPHAVQHLVRERRDEHARLAAMTPPDSFTLGFGESFSPSAVAASNSAVMDDADASATLQGTGACGGRIVSNAAVLADATEAGRMQQGDIVVTRQTDPGWACVFFLARGLVVERGGMLSHGAIIARELGIPAVVGVRHATRRIAHGVRLAVDGDRGVVDILS